MTEVPDPVKDAISSSEAQHALCLLRYYGFELDRYTVEAQLAEWLEQYPARMIVQGIIEALYQGRYKIVSVNQILALWHRRGQTICHFNHEFERLVGGNLPVAVQPSPEPAEPTAPASPAPTLSYREILLELPSVRAASKLQRLTEIPSLKLPYIRTGNDQTSNGTGSSGTGTGSSATETRDSPCEPNLIEFKPKPPASDRPLPPEPDPEREFKEFKEGVIFALSSGLAAHTLKPRLRLLLSRLYRIDWLQFCTSPKAIDQFIPALEPSEFHNKLKTVAEPGESAGE